MRALILLGALGACAPAPPFQGVGAALDATDVVSEGRVEVGPVTVRVTTRDGKGLPITSAPVFATSPNGAPIASALTGADGEATLVISRGDAVFVEDGTAPAPHLTVVLGAAPGEVLHVGGPTLPPLTAFTLKITASFPSMSVATTAIGATPCGRASANIQAGMATTNTVIDVPLDAWCTTHPFDAALVRRDMAAPYTTRYAVFARFDPVASGMSYSPGAEPSVARPHSVELQTPEGFTSYAGSLWSTDNRRRVANYPFLGAASGGATAVSTPNFAIGTDSTYLVELTLQGAGGLQYIGERRSWDGTGSTAIATSADRQAPWVPSPPVVNVDNALDWAEVGGGAATFVEASVHSAGDPQRVVRILAPHSALVPQGAGGQVRLALPPLPAGLQVYSFSATVPTTNVVHEYAFEPGVDYDAVRAEADLHVQPWSDFPLATSISHVAIGGAQLSTPE